MAVAGIALWIGATALSIAATLLAWRTRAVAGLLAGGLSAGAVAAATTGWAPAPAAFGLAVSFAVVSLVATAIGAVLTRLLEAEDSQP